MEVNYTEEIPQEPVNQEQIPSQEAEEIQPPVPANTNAYAGFLLRFIAHIIDGIVFGILAIILIFIVFAIFIFSTSASFDSLLTKMDEFIEGSILLNIISAILSWLYFALLESSSKQATLGKMVLGLKVTDLNGQRISFLKATVRHFSKIISAIILLIGYLMIIFTEKKQGLHDIIAGCLVVKG